MNESHHLVLVAYVYAGRMQSLDNSTLCNLHVHT